MLLPTIHVDIIENGHKTFDSYYYDVESYYVDFTKDELSVVCSEGDICISLESNYIEEYCIEVKIIR